jgi:hypothetical protein
MNKNKQNIYTAILTLQQNCNEFFLFEFQRVSQVYISAHHYPNILGLPSRILLLFMVQQFIYTPNT